MKANLHIAFFVSSLVSAYWNGAAAYYRGIIRAIAARGHSVTFYEPNDAYGRQEHRDIPDPERARLEVYSAEGEEGAAQALESARGADIIIKASGAGVCDALLEREVPRLKHSGNLVAFWDVDAPATLERIAANAADPFRDLIPRYDLILAYGGGDPVVNGYLSWGARTCVPIHNALDPSTHFPVQPDGRFAGELGFLGNRLPDRETRVTEFFFGPARELPEKQFLLGGSGWGDRPLPGNVRYLGHVYTSDHNALNSTAKAVLNVNRDSMAGFGFSPATRVFEAAGAGACVISESWKGIEMFLEPGREVLVAGSGAEVAQHLRGLTRERARSIGEAARRRVLAEHTYAHRAEQLERVLEIPGIRRQPAPAKRGSIQISRRIL